jgi:hypothetical protein
MAAVATAITGTGGTGNVRGWLLTCLDADTAFTITHGLPFASANEGDRRMVVILEPTHAEFYAASVVVTTRNQTQLVLTKLNAVSSGTGAGATGICRAWCKLQNRGE